MSDRSEAPAGSEREPADRAPADRKPADREPADRKPAGREPAGREAWIDVAKGMAIVLVVFFHSVTFLGDVGLASFWYPVIGVLDTFRMPLFFLTAGIFAAKALSLPFGSLFRRRIASLLWLYAVWSIVWAGTFAVVPAIRPRVLPLWAELLLLPVWPNASTWFVYALAAFFTIAWLVRALPLWAQFAPAVALTLLFGTGILDTGNDALDKMATYFVFFLLAARAGPHIRRVAVRARPWQALALFAVYAVVAVTINRAELTGVPGVRLAASVMAVAAGIALSVVLARIRQFDWLRLLGTKTLPVYLIHFYPILFVAVAVRSMAPDLASAAPVLAPILTVVAILVALGVHRVTRNVPGMYGLPARLAVPRSDLPAPR